ncbi:hypothetical protein V6N13_085085 [Hibiscus sabdariffa]
MRWALVRSKNGEIWRVQVSFREELFVNIRYQRGHGYLHHEPCTFLGGIANYPPPDIPMTVIAPGNTSSLDILPLPEHYENGVRNHGINVHPQVAATPYHFPANYASQSTLNPSRGGLEMGRRSRGPAPPTGFRIYHSRQDGGSVPEATLRYRNLPHLRVLPPDGVAMLEFPEFYDVGNFFDHHRDMRLDIEEMSYEELLALGERIGKVNTGLSEETITSKLKTRTYSTSVTNINLEEVAPVDQEPDSCIICQEDYKNQEKIGTLDCGHGYHAGCLSKWLFVKNVCPICKSEALTTKPMDV